jgi:hypothetical protein
VSLLELLLVAIVFLIPVMGFVLTLGYARKAHGSIEQRWRKNHGLLFWVLIPGAAGVLTVLGMTDILPRIFSLIGIGALGASTFTSWNMQKKREE